jgi:hypothetical protein
MGSSIRPAGGLCGLGIGTIEANNERKQDASFEHSRIGNSGPDFNSRAHREYARSPTISQNSQYVENVL